MRSLSLHGERESHLVETGQGRVVHLLSLIVKRKLKRLAFLTNLALVK